MIEPFVLFYWNDNPAAINYIKFQIAGDEQVWFHSSELLKRCSSSACFMLVSTKFFWNGTGVFRTLSHVYDGDLLQKD